MKKLNELLDQVNNQLINTEKINLDISKASVSWHLDHILKVINLVTENVSQSDPTEFKQGFNLPRFIVFLTGKIPRGKAKAPKSVQSYEKILEIDLRNQLEMAKISVTRLEKLQPYSHFKHPYFGFINVKQTIYFLKIHTKHHLKIVNDIVKS